MAGEETSGKTGDGTTAPNADAKETQDGNASGEQGGADRQQAKTFSQDDVNKLIDERLTRAKAKWDKDAATAAETAAKAAADKSLPEIERLRAMIDAVSAANEELTQKARDADAKEAVLKAATKLGATPSSMSAVYRMVKSDIEFDEDGAPTNVDALLADAKQIAPALFRSTAGKGDGGAGGGTRPAKNPNDWLRDAYLRQTGGVG